MAVRSDWTGAFERELGRVRGFLRRRVRDEGMADELASATFARALEREEQLRNPEALRAWLFAIARRVAVDVHRRGPDSVVPLAPDVDVPSDIGLDKALVQQELRSALRAALAHLPKRDRRVLVLRFGAGLTNRDIALRLGLTEGNVAKIVYRSLRALRAELVDWRPDDVF
jgi:RNA polymerase sigma-70 factor (ECF subfamily)